MVSTLPDLVALVTGSSSGVGLQTAIQLARQPEYKKVIFAVRNTEKAMKVIPMDISQKAIVMCLDLASLDSVDKFFDRLSQEGIKQIDRLVLNAGINDYTQKGHTRTIDGFDEIWQVNYLSHFYLSILLQPSMGLNGRIVCLSSVMHWFGEPSRFMELAKPTSAGLKYYSDSKLAMGILAHELDRRRGKQNVLAIAVNPGSVASDIFRTWFVGLIGWILKWVFAIMLLTTADGARTSVFACTSHEIERCEYLSPYGQIKGKGWVFACLSDMYWYRVASNPNRMIGECSRDAKSKKNGNFLWILSVEALALSGRGERVARIIDEYL